MKKLSLNVKTYAALAAAGPGQTTSKAILQGKTAILGNKKAVCHI
jgi:hypothetical protein